MLSGPGTRGSRTLVLCGIGGDAHSIGLILLRRMLERTGYRVRYLATQNSLAELGVAAVGADAILVSNMDGHARHYLRDLPEMQRQLGLTEAVWYLGGNPSVTKGEPATAELRALGFDRVFNGFVELSTVLATLDDDLGVEHRGQDQAGDPPARLGEWAKGRRATVAVEEPVAFAEQRDEVLLNWHTGAEARDIEPAAAALSRRCGLADAQRLADRHRRTLIQPRCGVARPDGQREIFHALRRAGADVLSFQIDSLTRNNAYYEVELALKEAAAGQAPDDELNGYPMVNHGVAELRALTAEFCDVPMQVRHSTRDPRLLAEISFAGGVAAFEGGAITYNLPYYRDYSPRESVTRWRYVDHLAGLYHERYGLVIDREFFGVLTASLVPPFVAVVVNVLEALLAAECGVKSVSLGYAEQGHRAQDVAAIRAMHAVARQYLDAFSFADVAVSTVFHQYMGAFPGEADKARELLRGSATTAGYSAATRIMVKTHVEARWIPDGPENADSVRLVRAALESARAGDADLDAVSAEAELITAEACTVLDAALRAGHDDFGEAVVWAIDLGYIDIPFSPSVWSRGQAISVRDQTGAVRLADAGRIPLPVEIREHHAELVGARLHQTGLHVEQLIEDDVLAVARGRFERWPLG